MTRKLIILGSLLTGVSVARVPPAWAEAPGSPLDCATASVGARELFEQGARYAEQGQYALALGCFEVAYGTEPHPHALKVIADMHRRLGRQAARYQTLKGLVERHAAELSVAESAQTRAALEQLESELAFVEASSSPSGAEVRIDDVVVGHTPLAVTPLTPGEHTFAFELASHFTIEQRRTTAKGKKLELHVRLHPSVLLHASCAVPKTVLVVDGQGQGAAERRSIALSPGTHSVRFEGAGVETDPISLALEVGKPQTIECVAREPKSTAPAPEGPRIDEAPGARGLPEWVGYASLGVGVALVGGAGGHWYYNVRRSEALERDSERAIADDAAYDEAPYEDRADTIYESGRITWGLGVTGGLLTLAGVWFVLTNRAPVSVSASAQGASLHYSAAF